MKVKKRSLLILLPFFLVGYLFYWMSAVRFIEDGFVNWVTQEIKTKQVNIQFQKIERSGFPFSLGIEVVDFNATYPDDEMKATIPSLSFQVSPLNWYNAHYSFKRGGEFITTKRDKITRITLNQMSGQMKTPWLVNQTDFNLSLKGINLDLPPIRGQTSRLNTKIDQLSLNFEASPAIPRFLNETTLSQWRDAGGVITLSETGGALAPTVLDLKGDLTLDNNNQPQFKGEALLIEGQALLNHISQTASIDEKRMMIARSFYKNFERSFKNPDGSGLKIPLNIRAGFLSVGPFPIMPIPQFHWEQRE